jgi:hypothetical protein
MRSDYKREGESIGRWYRRYLGISRREIRAAPDRLVPRACVALYTGNIGRTGWLQVWGTHSVLNHGREVDTSVVAGAGHAGGDSGQQTARTHQPDRAVFRSVLPEDIDWKPFAAFPPSVRLAVVVGQPSEPGPYVIRVKVPSGVRLMPHRHPEDRIYTVMSGVFYIGLGDQFDGDKVQAYPFGSVIVLPGNTSHFRWAKSGKYVTQVTAIGPLGLEYLDPGDDPRKLGGDQRIPQQY